MSYPKRHSPGEGMNQSLASTVLQPERGFSGSEQQDIDAVSWGAADGGASGGQLAILCAQGGGFSIWAPRFPGCRIQVLPRKLCTSDGY